MKTLLKQFEKWVTALRSNNFLWSKIKLTLFYIGISIIMLTLFNGILKTRIKDHMVNFREGISEEQAAEIAKSYNPDRKIIQIKKERLNGKNYFEVEFADNTEITIDAYSGESSNEEDAMGNPEDVFQDYLEDALFFVNLIIILFAGLVSYFLAAITLKPIEKKMLKEQQFTADVAHELRNPLAAMRAAAESALRKNIISKRETREILETILDDTIRLSSLTEDLLDLLSCQDSKKNFKRASLTTIIKHVIKRLEPLAKEKNIKFQQNIKNFTFVGDEKMLETLVFNLIHNAIKFSNKNGEIIINMDTNGEFTVQDFGTGIAAKHITNIFNRFYKADESRDFSVGGNGLGLSIVKEIANRHNAKIVVSSNIGKGTIFKILF